MELHALDCSVYVELVDLKSSDKKIKNCFNNKDKSEKIKNNRDIGDLIAGTNKDNTQYRTKLLPVNCGYNLSGDVGRRIWVPITRYLSKKK